MTTEKPPLSNQGETSREAVTDRLARLLEKAEKALLRDADAYFAQRAAQEALSLLKANERQIEQLHTLLEQEGSKDGR